MEYVKGHLDKVVAVLALVAGVITLFLGWRGVWHTLNNTAKQMPYIVSGGLTGIFLLGLGAMFWTSSDLRAERGNLDAAAQHLVTTGSLPPPVVKADPAAEVAELQA
ncbi:MAG TPA: hypothetical protein VHL53_07285 [Acidimicrobiia bacterium]|nr:hypothetical protein [Acidimicrobiia bacterium]